jgi:hypothetical protein
LEKRERKNDKNKGQEKNHTIKTKEKRERNYK